MRRAQLAALVLLGALLVAPTVMAEPCVTGTEERPVIGCFDPGNRLRLDVETKGISVEVNVRHVMTTDDPSVTWRFEHTIANAGWTGTDVTGALYQLRILRHSTDGHIMFPTSPPTRLHFPFDLGVELAAGLLRYAPTTDKVDLGVFRATPMMDLLKRTDFRRRLTVGVRGRWDVTFTVGGEANQVVSPMTEGEVALHLESSSGLTVFDVRAHAGEVWSTETGWELGAGATAQFERVLLSINDQSIAAIASGGFTTGDHSGSPSDPQGAWVSGGVRVGFGAARRR